MSLPSNFEEYDKKLNLYFKLKKDYENKLSSEKRKILKNERMSKKEKRNAIRKIKVKCKGCGRKVGMNFEIRDRQYIASCGSPDSPCELNIVLQRGNFAQIDNRINYANEEKQMLEDKIILLKLNLLFGFINEDQMKEEFDALMNEYELTKKAVQFYQKFLEIEQQQQEREEAITDKTRSLNDILDTHKQLMGEYMSSGDTSLVRSVVEEYVDEVLKLQEEIRDNKYLYINMEEDEKPDIYRLVKYRNPIYTTEAPVFEENMPQVVSFIIPSGKRA